MKKTRKKRITGILILSLATGLISPEAAGASPAKLNRTKLTLTQGKTHTLRVKGLSGTVTWTSSQKKVAVVSKKGKVTAKKAGKTKITAKTKAGKLVCKVTVKKRKPVATQTPDMAQKPNTTQKPVATPTPDFTQKPASTQTPDFTQKPITTQKPIVTQRPVATQKPVVTQSPIVTQRPVVTQKPVVTQSPIVTQRPIVTQKPVSTQKPIVTPAPLPTQKPDNTQPPSGSPVTEESAYRTLNSLRSTYPEGMPLTNSYYYYSPKFGNGYGCYGFAAKLSDTVFGTATPYKTHSTFSQIKVGDNIRIGNSHSVIVLTKSDNAITVVEGNYNSSVHWDRKITSASLASSGFTVYTRY